MSSFFDMPPGSARKPDRPVLNRAHPLARGLVGLWVPSRVRGSTLHDLSNRNNATISGPQWSLASDPLWGNVLDFNGTTDDVTFPSPGIGSPLAVSWLAWIRPDVLTAYDGLFFSRDAVAVGLLFSGAAGNPLTILWDGFTQEYDRQTNLPLQVGRWNMCVGVVDSVTDVHVSYLGVDGRVSSDTYSIGTLVKNLDQQWSIGEDPFSERAVDGAIGLATMWDRALTMTEVHELYKHPWSLVTPPQRVPVGTPVDTSIPVFAHHYRQLRRRAA